MEGKSEFASEVFSGGEEASMGEESSASSKLEGGGSAHAEHASSESGKLRGLGGKGGSAKHFALTSEGISALIAGLGLVLVLVGFFLPVPGTYLTTYESLDGDTSSSGKKYSAIDEYVGGDAYNYITGAALVGGEIAGAKTQKAIFISSGLVLSSIGGLSYVRSRERGERK